MDQVPEAAKGKACICAKCAAEVAWFAEIWFERLLWSRTFRKLSSSPVCRSELFALVVRAPSMASNFPFTCIMKPLSANLGVLAGKLHYETFEVITRNITRSSKKHISCWFIWVFDEPGFLLNPQAGQLNTTNFYLILLRKRRRKKTPIPSIKTIPVKLISP